MLLSAIRAECYQRLNFGTSPTSDVVTRLDAFINSAIREILADPICSKLRNDTVPLTTNANDSMFAAPQAVVDIKRIVDRGNQFELHECDQAWIRSQDPGRLVSGTTPTNYAVVGYQKPVAKQPSGSSQIYVQSSSGADTTQTAYIEVMTHNGYTRQSSVVLTGLTPVALGPTNTDMVIDFYLSAVATGDVSITEGSGGIELAKVGIGKYRAKYCVLEFFPQTSAAITLYADVQWAVTDLVNATDEPLIPDEFQEAIIHKVRAREYNKREKTALAKAAEMDAIPSMNHLKFYMHARRGKSNEGRPSRWSQLGPYYVAGS